MATMTARSSPALALALHNNIRQQAHIHTRPPTKRPINDDHQPNDNNDDDDDDDEFPPIEEVISRTIWPNTTSSKNHTQQQPPLKKQRTHVVVQPPQVLQLAQEEEQDQIELDEEEEQVEQEVFIAPPPLPKPSRRLPPHHPPHSQQQQQQLPHNNNTHRSSRRPTTTTTATTATATTQQDKERHEKEVNSWRQKYRKAFPSFVFYFDHVDEHTTLALTKLLDKLGSTVDNFFSKKVTHVVTTRPIPSTTTTTTTTNNNNKENLDSPHPAPRHGSGSTTTTTLSPFTASLLAAGAGALPLNYSPGLARNGHAQRGTSTTARNSPRRYLSLDGQQLRQYGENFDRNPFIDHPDVLSKAQDFGIKIWRLDKLQTIISRINQTNSPTKPSHHHHHQQHQHHPNPNPTGLTAKPSLPTLLREEQLYGTRERDPFVPRSDMHYFAPGNKYLLVEDSTGEHRPIVVKEYAKPTRNSNGTLRDAQYPVLWGGVESRSAFYNYQGPPIRFINTVVNPNLSRKGGGGGEEVGRTRGGHQTLAARAVAPQLRRTASLGRIQPPNTHTNNNTRLDQNHNPVVRGGGVGVGVTNSLNVHAPRAERPSYLAASGNSQTITSTIASATSTRAGPGGGGGGQQLRGPAGFHQGNGPMMNPRLASLSRSTVPTRFGFGGTATGAGAASGSGSGVGYHHHHHQQQQQGQGTLGKLKRSVSVDAGLNPRGPTARVFEEPKKPGYCENCRLKYDDFKEHVLIRKHRKFAKNPDNWLELDSLLAKIERPVRPFVPSPSPEGDEDEDEDEDEELEFVSEGDSGYFEQNECCESDEPEEGYEEDGEGFGYGEEEEEEEEEEEGEEDLMEEEEEEQEESDEAEAY
ncbi:hypothetical protein T439DRAFT_67385 [Meredithblackwellia eburnea MCA 4105]